MIIALTGPNSFGLQHELDKLIAAFMAQHNELGLERLDGQEVSFERLRESLTSLPFLATKKLLVLRAPSTNKQFTDSFEQLLSEIPETNDMILVEPKLDKRLSYYKFLKKQTDFREFPELDQHNLATWLVSAVKEQGGSLQLSDARYLVERIGANQQLLSNELEKLLLYSSNITRQTIDLLTDPTPQSTIFQLLESAFAGNAKRTLGLYAEQRALKVEPAQIIAMLSWQLHVLAIIKTATDHSAEAIAQKAKLNPFVVRKSQSIARELSLIRLKKLVSDLLQLDITSKRSAIDSDEALQHYLLTLAEG